MIRPRIGFIKKTPLRPPFAHKKKAGRIAPPGPEFIASIVYQLSENMLRLGASS